VKNDKNSCGLPRKIKEQPKEQHGKKIMLQALQRAFYTKKKGSTRLADSILYGKVQT
jgi:hypothetical protein